VPTGPLGELRRQRLDVTRDRLAKVEGIPEARLQAAPEGASPPAAPAEAPPTQSAEGVPSGGRGGFGITGEGDRSPCFTTLAVYPRQEARSGPLRHAELAERVGPQGPERAARVDPQGQP